MQQSRGHEIGRRRDDDPVERRVLIAFIRDILAHLGELTAPSPIAPARGPPLGEAVSAEREPTPDPALPPIPPNEFDQRIAW